MKKSSPKKIKIQKNDQADEEMINDDYFQILSSPEKYPPQEETGWLEEGDEGQLSVDVYQTQSHIIVKSTVAGTKPEDIEVQLNNDLLTVRGKRYQEDEVNEDNYFYRECYWGNFSRSIVLPVEVQPTKITAKLKGGILTISLPKAKMSQSVQVDVVEEEEQ